VETWIVDVVVVTSFAAVFRENLHAISRFSKLVNQMITVAVQKEPVLDIFKRLFLRLPFGKRPQLVERKIDIPQSYAVASLRIKTGYS
jgi:hypothetical protein